MKKLLKLSLAFVVMVVFAAGTMAQSADRKGMSKEEKVKMKVERMKTELSLSDEQATKIQSIYMNHLNSSDKSGTKEDWKNHKEAMQSEIKAVLTAEQLEKYEALQAERKEKIKEKHQHKNHNHKSGEKRKGIQDSSQENSEK